MGISLRAVQKESGNPTAVLFHVSGLASGGGVSFSKTQRLTLAVLEMPQI
jgi:hypothetical protein